MKKNPNISAINGLHIADPRHYRQIWELQIRTYLSDFEHQFPGALPLLLESLPHLSEELSRQTTLVFFDEEQLVGVVAGKQQQNGEVLLERLAVHPSFQNRGIGQHLVKRIEGWFPSARRFSLFTDARNYRNVRFFLKLGYRFTHAIERFEGVNHSFFEKLPTNSLY